MYNKVRMVHCLYLGGHRLQFSKNIVFLSLKVDFVLTNSADPDEMPHYAAFQLGLLCLPKYLFMGFWSSMVKLYVTFSLLVSYCMMSLCQGSVVV